MLVDRLIVAAKAKEVAEKIINFLTLLFENLFKFKNKPPNQTFSQQFYIIKKLLNKTIKYTLCTTKLYLNFNCISILFKCKTKYILSRFKD